MVSALVDKATMSMRANNRITAQALRQSPVSWCCLVVQMPAAYCWEGLSDMVGIETVARRLEVPRVQKLNLKLFAVAKQDYGLVKALDNSQVAKWVVACSVRNINGRLHKEEQLMYQLKARDNKA